MIEQLIEHAKDSMYRANRNQGKIASDWRVMDQFSISSKRFKLLLNNLCELENAVYLELGCFRGGTLTSALLNNNVLAAYAVDNFCYDPLGNWVDPETKQISNVNPDGWENVKLSLFSNLERLNLDKVVKLFVGNWSKLPNTFIKHKINIFHVDISENIKTILDYYDTRLDDNFILVIPNYNISEVRESVANYIKDKNYIIKLQDTNVSFSSSDSDGWWNGVGFFVIQKKKEVVND